MITMFPKYLPIDIFKIITSYAWDRKLSLEKLHYQIDRLIDIHESIPEDLFSLCAYDIHLKRNIVTPYRERAPFFPVDFIDKQTVWSMILYSLPAYLRYEYFTRTKTYRSILKKHLDRLIRGGFFYYNAVLERFLIKIRKEDFLYNFIDFQVIYDILQLCDPISTHLHSL